MSRPGEALDRAAGILGFVAAVLSAGILACVTCHIVLEIVLRNVFGTSTYAVDELVGYGVGAMSVLAMAHTLREGGMIRVQILLARLQGGPRKIVEIACALICLAPVALIANSFAATALRSWREGRVSTGYLEVPMWMPEAVFAGGLFLLALQLVTYALRLIFDRDARVFESGIVE